MYDSEQPGVHIVSSAYDIVVGGVVTIMMFVFHRIGVELFAPGGTLYSVAAEGTQNLSGAQHANTWFNVIAVWMPMLFIGGIWAWVMIRAYKRQIATARPTPR